MFFRKLIGLAFMAMLFFGAMSLFGVGRGQTQAAWVQGYAAGQQSVTVNADGTTTVPPVPGNDYGYGRNRVGFFPGFGFLACLIPLFFIGGLFMLFGGGHRMHRYGRGSWRRNGPCNQHGHEKYKGPKPSWVADDDLADEPIMKA